jgi:hypothetical protein
LPTLIASTTLNSLFFPAIPIVPGPGPAIPTPIAIDPFLNPGPKPKLVSVDPLPKGLGFFFKKYGSRG